MDSTGDYSSGPVVHLGYNWQHGLTTHYPYPSPAIALMSSGDSYNPYSPQQIAPTPNNAAPVPLPYPPTAVFAGHAPSFAVPAESLDHLKQALQKIQELPQMADPHSLMASLNAVATAGVQVSRTLYSIANVIGGASEEILSIGREISAFSGVLRDLHEFLDDAKDLISMRALLNANHILRDCKNVFAKIQRMLDSCNAGPRTTFGQNLQWTFRREKVKPMCAKLESFKLTLAILLSIMRLARCKQEIGNSKSPTSRSKEQRYRANLETDILNNSAAIIRWHRVEIEVKSAHNAHPYAMQKQSPATPSRELEWLSNLVPYKPSQPQIVPSGFLPLPPIPETSDHLDEQAQVRITKAVDVLLAKWTTLYSFVGRSRPGTIRNASQTSGDRRKPKLRSRTVEELVSTDDAESEEASSSATEPSSSDHTTTASNDSERLTKPQNRHDRPGAERIHSPSNPIEPAPIPIADVEINKTSKEGVSERVTSRPNNITIEQLSKDNDDDDDEVSEIDDEGTGADDGTDGDEDEVTSGYEYEDLSYSGTDHTESEQSKASPNHSVASSEAGYDYRGLRPAHLRHRPPPSSSSDSCAFNHTPNLPQYQGSPYGPWPYGPPPNFPSSYSPGPYAPLPYNHVAYGIPPPAGYAQTMYGSPAPIAPVSYMSPPLPGIVPGPYPGLSSVPTPQPAPLAHSHNDSPSKRRDQQVDDLEGKVESLKKDLELKEVLDRKEKLLLEEQLAKQAARRAKEEEAENSTSEKRKRDIIEDKSSDTRIIRFKDAIGRKFTFPYQQCKRWVDMETLIEQAFANIHNSMISDHVKSGRFDLSDPSGAVILPSIWETVIQPDSTITMHMWPLPEASLPEEPLSEETMSANIGPSGKVPPPPPPPPPAVPIPPSTTSEPIPRAPRREAVIVVEENISRDSRRETDSETRSISTDDDSDDSNLKSSFQDMLTESFGRHGQRFEETWEAVMAKSRVKAQKTILEMWLSASEAELRKLETPPFREQHTRELDQKTPVISTEIPEDSANCDNVQDGEIQALKGLLRSDYARSSGQGQPPFPSTGDARGSTLCQSCQSPLLSSRLELQTPAINKLDPFRSLGGDSEPILSPHVSPQHFPPQSTLEQRIEVLEDFIKRKEADRQAKLDKAKAVENEQRLNRLEKAIVQTDVKTPPSTPVISETSPTSPTNSSPRRPMRSQSVVGTVSNDGRPSFRKRLFSRSISSSVIAS